MMTMVMVMVMMMMMMMMTMNDDDDRSHIPTARPSGGYRTTVKRVRVSGNCGAGGNFSDGEDGVGTVDSGGDDDGGDGGGDGV